MFYLLSLLPFALGISSEERYLTTCSITNANSFVPIDMQTSNWALAQGSLFSNGALVFPSSVGSSSAIMNNFIDLSNSFALSTSMSMISTSTTPISTSFFTLEFISVLPSSGQTTTSFSIAINPIGAVALPFVSTTGSLVGNLGITLGATPMQISIMYDQSASTLSIGVNNIANTAGVSTISTPVPIVTMPNIDLTTILGSSSGYFRISALPSPVSKTWVSLQVSALALSLVPISVQATALTNTVPLSVSAGVPLSLNVNTVNVCGRAATYFSLPVQAQLNNTVSGTTQSFNGVVTMPTSASGNIGIKFYVTAASIYSLAVTVGGINIQNSPFSNSVNVNPGMFDGANTVPTGNGLTGGAISTQYTVSMASVDSFNNVITSLQTSDIQAFLVPANSVSSAQDPYSNKVNANVNVVYSPTSGSSSAMYHVDYSYSTPGYYKLYIRYLDPVTNTAYVNVPGSPFNIVLNGPNGTAAPILSYTNLALLIAGLVLVVMGGVYGGFRLNRYRIKWNAAKKILEEQKRRKLEENVDVQYESNPMIGGDGQLIPRNEIDKLQTEIRELEIQIEKLSDDSNGLAHRSKELVEQLNMLKKEKQRKSLALRSNTDSSKERKKSVFGQVTLQ